MAIPTTRKELANNGVGANSSPGPGKRLIVFGIKAAVTVILLALVLNAVDIGPVLARFAQIAWLWAIVAAATLAAQLVVSGIRWYYVCRILDMLLSASEAVKLMMIGQFFSQTLPSNVGGDAVRIWLVSRSGTAIGKAISSVFCDRILGLVLLITLITCTLPFYPAGAASPELGGSLPTILGFLMSGLLLGIMFGPAVLWPFKVFRVGKAGHQLAVDLRRIFFGSRTSAGLAALGIAVHIGVVATAFALARALGVSIGFLDCLAVIPPVMLAAVLPISIAGWGVREGAMVVSLGWLDVPTDAALAISISFGLLQLLLAVPGGAIWAFWTRRGPA